MIFKSTKSYYNLPCSHQQHFDSDESGKPGTGVCATTHGYSREFHFEFSSETVDDNGWVIGFGDLKPLKKWLDFMFDHTSLFEANDPRLKSVTKFNEENDLFNLRVLPSGVSMEQTSLFVSIIANHYILDITEGRCWVSKLEVKENDKNSGILELDKMDAINMREYQRQGNFPHFPMMKRYKYIAPKEFVDSIFHTRGVMKCDRYS